MKTGIYTYRIRKIDGSFESHKMPVEIVDEHTTTYLIRFMHTHADGRGFGARSWVKKQNVYIMTGAKSLQQKQFYQNNEFNNS
jgi:hypothetical protein